METIMISYGELGTKGKNRPQFIKRLYKNICLKVHQLATVKRSHDRIYIQTDSVDQVVTILKTISGIKNIAVVKEIAKTEDLTKIKDSCLALLQDARGTFKIKCRRIDKSFKYTSDQVARLVGKLIEDEQHLVDLYYPDNTIFIEIRQNIYIYMNKIKGLGGYPLGTLGKALILLSGGIDSPVAAYQLIRRGIMIEAIHFASPPYTSSLALQKVKDLLAKLQIYQSRIVLHVVDFAAIQEKIYQVAGDRYAITLMRRLMYRIACRVAEKRHINLLASGDSIGQVASQTDSSLFVVDKIIDRPLLRPLALVDKESIIDIAKSIDTYELSILPYQDCCTIFNPKAPTTAPKLELVEQFEVKLAWETLLEHLKIESIELNL